MPLALEDAGLHWRERADGVWHADHLAVHYEAVPWPRGQGFAVWAKPLRGEWERLGHRETLGGAFALASAHAAGASKAAEDPCSHGHPPEVPTTPCAEERAPVVYEAGIKGFSLRVEPLWRQNASVRARLRKLSSPRGEMRAHLDRHAPKDQVIIAQTPGKIIGWGLVSMRPYSSGDRELHVFVDPAFRQRGVGRAIARKAETLVGKAKLYAYPHDDAGTRTYSGGTIEIVRNATGAPAAEEEVGELAVVERNVEQARKGRAKGQIKTAEDVYNLVHPVLVKQHQETFIVVPLDIHGQPTSPTPYEVARGQRDRVAVDPSDVLRPVIKDNAKGFVVCHNHPSGKGRASKADVELTKTLNQAAGSMGLVLIDHVVVGDGQYQSIRKSYGKRAGFN